MKLKLESVGLPGPSKLPCALSSLTPLSSFLFDDSAIGRTPAQTIQRLTLYQALSRHTTDPLNFALPPIPNPNDPASYGVEEFMARRAGAGGAPGPGAVVQASKENPWAGKQMPMPARPDQGGGGDDPARDSQGRLFGAPMMRREDMDENGEERGDAEAAERRRESERERGMQGGGALGQSHLVYFFAWRSAHSLTCVRTLFVLCSAPLQSKPPSKTPPPGPSSAPEPLHPQPPPPPPPPHPPSPPPFPLLASRPPHPRRTARPDGTLTTRAPQRVAGAR